MSLTHAAQLKSRTERNSPAIMPSTIESAAKSGDPGLSLWLIPPEDGDIYKVLNNAITHLVPRTLKVSDAPRFEPHVTLTSRIPSHSVGSDPQRWLDEMDLPSVAEVEVKFQELALGDAFFKKLFIRCERSESLLRLAASCRVFSSSKTGEAEYDAHVSLL